MAEWNHTDTLHIAELLITLNWSACDDKWQSSTMDEYISQTSAQAELGTYMGLAQAALSWG
jgi:hypothetical protein